MFNYFDKNNGYPKVGKMIVHGLILVILVILLFSSFGTVSSGELGVKTRFNKVRGVLGAGLYVKLPFIEHVNIMSARTLTILFDNKQATGDNSEYTSLAAASKDLQDVSVAVVVNYHINGAKMDTIFQQYQTVHNYQLNVLEPLVRETVKSTSALYTAEELVTKRSDVATAISKSLTTKFEEKDAVVETFSITNFEFSKAFSEAIEAKVTAVQQAEAAKNKLEQVKFEAQQAIEEANGKARAIQIEGEALKSNANVTQLRWIEKWNGQVPQYWGSASPFIGIDK